MKDHVRFQMVLRDLGIPYRGTIIGDGQPFGDSHYLIQVGDTDFKFKISGEFLEQQRSSDRDPSVSPGKLGALVGHGIDPWMGYPDRLSMEPVEQIDDRELPMLVITTSHKYNFKEPELWRALDHQHGGMICDHTCFMARRLEPTKACLKLMMDLDRSFEGAAGWDPDLDTVNEYRSMLQSLGLDCRHTYGEFSEALYPIDISLESLSMLTEESLPNDLDSMVDWGDDARFKVFGILGRWKLFILGRNSD